jgi:hypothetical protein
MAAGRMSALSLPIEQRSGVEFRAYARRTPVFSFNTGRLLVSSPCPSESGPNMSPSPGRWLSRRRRTRSRWSGSTAAATRLGGRRDGVRLHLHHAHRPAR